MTESTGSATGAPAADAKRPWLGLLSFSEATRDFFFGRDAEIREIRDRIEENTLTTLFGQSGLGKTSLLAAGVLPLLRESGKSPVLLRLDHDPAAPPLLDQTRAALQLALPGIEWPADAAQVPLWELFHRLPLLIPPGAPVPVLLLDQFEEIFTLARQHPAREAAAGAWLEEISDLIQSRPPRSLEERFAGNRRLARDYDFGRSGIRFVFSLREDFLSHLEGWKDKIPLLVQNRMPLNLLDGPRALEAVLGPASLGDQPLVSPEVAASIVRTVARKPADTPLAEIRAVPPLLSLLCEQLNLARLAAGAAQIDSSMVSGRSEDILQRFYEESFTAFPDAHREKIRAVVEDRMVTVSGHRHPVARDDAEAALFSQGIPHPDEVFNDLIGRRLLTAEEQGGVQRLEVTHDVLLPLLIRSRKERQDRQEREAFERKKAEQAAKTRKQWVAASVIAVLTAVGFAGFVMAARSYRANLALIDELHHKEGLVWLKQAKVAGSQEKKYPDSLVLAAQAIGFEGAGRSPHSKEPISLLNEKNDSKFYLEAVNWIKGQPAYLPVWGKGFGAAVSGLEFTAGGRELAIATAQGQVALCDFTTGECRLLAVAGEGPILGLASQPFENRLAIARPASTYFCTAAGGTTPRAPLAGETHALAWSPDGSILALARADGTIELLREDETLAISTGQNVAASSLSFSADRRVLAAAFPGKGVRILFPAAVAAGYSWQITRVRETDATGIPPLNVTAVALSADGRRLACGTETGSIEIWDTLKVRMLGQIPPWERHRAAIRDLHFRGDGRQLASASDDGFIKLWNTADDSAPLVATLSGHTGRATQVRYAPGGDLLASAGSDGSVKLWDVSGASRSDLDLLAYQTQENYHFDEWGQLQVKHADIPWVNLPFGSIAALWKDNPAKILKLLRDAGDHPGSAAGLAALSGGSRNEAATDLATAWTGEARQAVDTHDLDLSVLRVTQLEASKLPHPPGLTDLRAQQEAIGRQGTNFTSGYGIGLVWCPAGTFKMGSPPGENGHAPKGETQHDVTLTKGFWIGSHEVTQEQWLAIMETNPSQSTNYGTKAPVEYIDWHQALEFCKRLTDHERFLGMIPVGWEYSLPTQAQWQYACRAGNPDAYSFGPNREDLQYYGNYRDGSYAEKSGLTEPPEDRKVKEDFLTDWRTFDGWGPPAPVGSYRPNDRGIYDMHGNVSEWCLDHVEMANQQHIQPADEDTAVEDPYVGPDPDRLDRKVCGGSWVDSRNDNRSAKSVALRSTTKKWTIGMRVVLVPVGAAR